MFGNYFSKKLFITLLIILAMALFLAAVAPSEETFNVNLLGFEKNSDKPENGQGCASRVEERIVRGDSLSGLIEAGQTIKINFNYYACHEIKKGDIVAYNYAGNTEPIIKIIKGIPGDLFKLEETQNGWNILINREVTRNSFNQPYILDEKGFTVLSLYERSYKGKIPADTFLIFGNLSSGSLDSSRFGLIDKSDILGKVELVK